MPQEYELSAGNDEFSRFHHHRFKLLSPQIQPMRMARKFAKLPSAVKGLCAVVNAIDNYRDECESPAGFPAITKSLSKQSFAKSPSLMDPVDAEPRQDSDGKHALGQPLSEFGR